MLFICYYWGNAISIWPITLNLLGLQGLEKFGSSDFIGIKRMGDLELKPFYRAAKRKYCDPEAGEKAAELCSIWEDFLRDSSWHPFKIVMGKEGNYVVCI